MKLLDFGIAKLQDDDPNHLDPKIVASFLKEALADKAAVPFRIPPGIKLVRVNIKTGLRVSGREGGSVLEAFKPNEEPDDAYSVIGFDQHDTGRQPDQDRALRTGRGTW